MDALGALQWIQALLFAGLGAVGARAYRRRHSRPAAYVAAAFATLALVTLGGRLWDLFRPDRPHWLDDLTVVALVAFPWLLAAFAWSFSGRLPRWLRVAGLASALLAATIIALPPLGDRPDRDAGADLYVAVLLTQWAVLIGAAAIHLWGAGRGGRASRARTRLLASGAVVLAATLVVAGTADGSDAPGLATGTALAAIVAAALFAAGVAPPAVLRRYWRRLPDRRMHEMQTALVAAATPAEVAGAVTPVLGDTFGVGALCADRSGRVVAHHGLALPDAERIAASLAAGGTEPADVRALAVEGWWLAVLTSPYAPLFGEDERYLLARFGSQFRLALQRAELFAEHERDRAELERSSAEIQAMLVGLAHDLRSPAVTISTYAALLRDARDDADREQMITGIQDSSAYLDRLVEGLLELSRIGRSDGEPEPVALDTVVRGVARRLDASRPDVSVEITSPLPTICVDRLRIEQVVDNLLGNAAKHGGRSDLTIRIWWEPGSDGGTVIVADDGRGVPEGEREAVFALFRRGSDARSSGSGVGLGLVRRIVESYGGRIRFAPSERGARIELWLPGSLLRPSAEVRSSRTRRAVSRPPA